MVNPIQAAAALALTFLLPGFFIVKALFPRERIGGEFHALLVLFLSVVTSVVVTILVGSALGFLGLFSGAATGAPRIELALFAVTALAAAAAVWRGAFPRIRARTTSEARRGARPTLTESGFADAARHRADAWRAARDGRADDAARAHAAADRAEEAAREREYGVRPHRE